MAREVWRSGFLVLSWKGVHTAAYSVPFVVAFRMGLNHILCAYRGRVFIPKWHDASLPHYSSTPWHTPGPCWRLNVLLWVCVYMYNISIVQSVFGEWCNFFHISLASHLYRCIRERGHPNIWRIAESRTTHIFSTTCRRSCHQKPTSEIQCNRASNLRLVGTSHNYSKILEENAKRLEVLWPFQARKWFARWAWPGWCSGIGKAAQKLGKCFAN